jgi:hypothetical protein
MSRRGCKSVSPRARECEWAWTSRSRCAIDRSIILLAAALTAPQRKIIREVIYAFAKMND